ncbi:MAG: hypothetical protein KAI97_04975 [Gemmatimonadetes bacterium]|nr:hypothetical protein [Gemmatimonadota bacterium]
MALLGDLQRVFETTYGRETGVDLETCVVGPRRCAELVVRSQTCHAEMSDLARFFFYVEDANLRLALFFDDRVISTLEDRDPRGCLSEENVLPFLVLTEELSHAIHTTYAFTERGSSQVVDPNFLTELELLARIDAYLLLRLFVRGLARNYTATDRAWVRHQAVTRWEVAYEDGTLDARYRGAARHASRFIDHLEALPPDRRLDALRSFRRMPLTAKQVMLGHRN